MQTVDLFKYRFVFVPIHDHLHWSLAIICNAGKTVSQTQANAPFILHLDSLKGARYLPDCLFTISEHPPFRKFRNPRSGRFCTEDKARFKCRCLQQWC